MSGTKNTIVVLDREPFGGTEHEVFLALETVLRALPDKCHGLSWAAFDLWIGFEAEDPHDLASLSALSESDSGAAMTWDELRAFAKLGEQVIEGQFIGYRLESDPPNLPDRDAPLDTKFDQNCDAFEIVLEAVDSSFWKICSRDAAMIEELSKKFQDVE